MQRLWALVSGLNLDDSDDEFLEDKPPTDDVSHAEEEEDQGNADTFSAKLEDVRQFRHCALLLRRFAEDGLEGVDRFPEFVRRSPGDDDAFPPAVASGAPGSGSTVRGNGQASHGEAEEFGVLVPDGGGSQVTNSTEQYSERSGEVSAERKNSREVERLGPPMSLSPSDVSAVSRSASVASSRLAPAASETGPIGAEGALREPGGSVSLPSVKLGTERARAVSLASEERTLGDSREESEVPGHGFREGEAVDGDAQHGNRSAPPARADGPVERADLFRRDSFDRLTEALGTLAQLLVRGDQDNLAVWEEFLEHGSMNLLVKCLERTQTQGDKNIAQARPEGGKPVLSKMALHSGADIYANGKSAPTSVNAGSDASFGPGRGTSLGREHTAGTGVVAFPREQVSSVAARIQAEVLRSVSILVHSVRRRESLYTLFSANHINRLLEFPFTFGDEEVILFYMSAAKSMGTSLDGSMLQLFFDERSESFPLYTVPTQFNEHHDAMVRIAIRNLTLTIFALKNETLSQFIVRDTTGYLGATVDRLCRLCGEVARAFEFILDDGREFRRSVGRRMGRVRHKVRMPQLQSGLEEIGNLIEYLNDVASVGDGTVSEHVVRLACSRFIGPFFRPIASQASPEAVALAKRRWGFRSLREEDEAKLQPAISSFDACARAMVLCFLLNRITTPRLAARVLSELTQPSTRFQLRTALHGLRAIASDLGGKERSTHVALCALESIIRLDGLSTSLLKSCGLVLDVGSDEEFDDIWIPRVDSSARSDLWSQDRAESNGDGTVGHLPSAPSTDEPRLRRESGSFSGASDSRKSMERVGSMVLSLGDFKAPLTPTTPLTPTSSSHSVAGSASADIAWEGLEMSSPAPSSAHSMVDYGKLSDPGVDEADQDEEGILSAFRRGEASLREIVSSVLLVVRTHEVRTTRVAQAVCRVISGVGLRTGNWEASLEVAKIALDEMASMLMEFLKDGRTTIVAIEASFDSFSSAAEESSEACSRVPDLSSLCDVDSLHELASVVPRGSGRRRRSAALGNAFVQPTDAEDAKTFFVLLRAYEQILTEVVVARGVHATAPNSDVETSLYRTVSSILQDEDSRSTYLDKKDALNRVARETLKYSMRTRLGLVGIDALL